MVCCCAELRVSSPEAVIRALPKWTAASSHTPARMLELEAQHGPMYGDTSPLCIPACEVERRILASTAKHTTDTTTQLPPTTLRDGISTYIGLDSVRDHTLLSVAPGSVVAHWWTHKECPRQVDAETLCDLLAHLGVVVHDRNREAVLAGFGDSVEGASGLSVLCDAPQPSTTQSASSGGALRYNVGSVLRALLQEDQPFDAACAPGGLCCPCWPRLRMPCRCYAEAEAVRAGCTLRRCVCLTCIT